MEPTGVQKLAWVLKILVTITFLCNLLVLPLVPVLVSFLSSGIPVHELLSNLTAPPPAPGDDFFYLSPPLQLFLLLLGAWRDNFSYTLVLTCFLLFCGVCTAVMLWQARRVLNTILRGAPFCQENGQNLRRAAVCCFLISLFALIRLLWGFFYYGSPAPLLTYNALFCPIFLMGGLLCMVVSALFRQAAELKEENDLTI